MLRRTLLGLAAALPPLSVTGLASAQTAWPSRPLRMVIPFPPGGPTDAFARLYATALGQQLGQPVVLENKAGASGAVGALEVRRSAPDGYTLLFGTASTHVLYNLIQPKPQFDALADFSWVGVLGGAPLVFAVGQSMPGTLREFTALSRAQPGKLSYGSPGAGTMMHIAAERLKQLTGAQVEHVPYKGSAPARQDLLGGTLQMAVDTLGPMLPQHQAGRVRIVGVASARRATSAPDIPTVAESAGLSEPFEAMLWNVVTVPRETPADLVRALAEATRRAMADPALRSQLETQAMFADIHLGADAERYARSELAKWKPIVDQLGDQARG
ncbi:MAG: Bug family tripartite tricarboxylate transporter substrate binding protein [Betaproteobacteria bacterium]